jgi:hypothetical protein
MIGDLLDKIVSDGKETIDTLKEIVPFIVIGVLWLLGAIAKTVQASKKSEQKDPQKKTVKKPRSENLADFIRIVKEQYASARAQATKTTEQPSVMLPSAQPVARPRPPMIEVTTPAEQPVFEKPPVKEPPPALEPVSLTSAGPAETKVEHPAEMTTVSEIHETHPNPYLAELTKQFTDADGLRKAVLYSEILGRPVALRRE